MATVCKNCASQITFDPKTQKVVCHTCGSSWDPQTVDVHEEFPDLRYRRVRGRLYIEFADKRDFSDAELDRVCAQLRLRALGIENFSPAIVTTPDMENISNMVKVAGETIFPDAIAAAHREGRTLRFRIRARRSDKKFPLRSQEIEIALCTVLGGIYGRENIIYESEEAETGEYAFSVNLYTFLTINAIDGTVIDRGYGY